MTKRKADVISTNGDSTAKTAKAAKAAKASSPAKQSKASAASGKLVKQLANATLKAFKKQGHSGKNHPITNIKITSPSRAVGEEAMGAHGDVLSSTKTLEVREVVENSAQFNNKH